MGDDVDGSTKVILGLIETHEKFNRLDWGDDIEHPDRKKYSLMKDKYFHEDS